MAEEKYNEFINYIRLSLGWPVVTVELIEPHYVCCINKALMEWAKYGGGNAGEKSVGEYKFQMNPGQTRYDNVPDDLDYIISLTDRGTNILGITGIDDWLIYWNSEQNRNFFRDIADFYIKHGFIEFAKRTVGAEKSWEIVRTADGKRHLGVYPSPGNADLVYVRYALKPDIKNITHEMAHNKWILDWALSEAKIILGRIRSKFRSGYPVSQTSGGGLVQLDGEALINEGIAEQDKLRTQVKNWRAPLYPIFG